MNKIKGYRNMLNLNQKEMAELLGISKQSYWNKENGKNEFSDKEKIIIKKIKGYRNNLKLNKKEMAELLSITKQSYWNKENGKNEFSDKEKIIIKRILEPFFPKISIDEIFFEFRSTESTSERKCKYGK